MEAFLARFGLRQLWLLGGGLLAVLAMFLLMDAVRPQLKAYRSAVAAKAALQTSQATEPARDALLVSESEQVTSLGQKLHGEMADIPARELEAVVVGRLQSVSWRHGVELASVSPARGEQIDMFEEILFNVELNGQYDDVYAWLEDLHGELGFVVIKDFAIERAAAEGVDTALRARLTLASYRALGS